MARKQGKKSLEQEQALSGELTALLNSAGKRRRPGRKAIIIGLSGFLFLVAAALVIVLPLGSKQAEGETVYREYNVERGSITVGQKESSSISLERESITFPVTATVEEVYVKAGSSVQAGDPLVRMNLADIEAGLKSYELQLEVSGLELKQAKLQMETKLLTAKQQMESSNLNGSLAKTNEELSITGLDQDLLDAQTNLAKAQTELEEYCALNTTFASDYGYLEYLKNEVDYYSDWQTGLSDQQTTASTYESQLTAAQKEYTAMQQVIGENKTLSDYQAEIDAAKTALEAAVSEQAAAKAALDAAKESLALEPENPDLQAAVKAAQSDLDRADLSYSGALSQEANAEASHATLKEAQNGLAVVLERIASLEQKLLALGGSADLSGKVASAKSELSAAQSAYEEWKEYFNNRYGSISDVQTLLEKIDEAETAINKAELNLGKTEAANQTGALDAEQKKETALTEAETAKSAYELTEMELSQAIDAAQEEYDYLEDQIEQVRAMLNGEGMVYAPCNGLIAGVNVGEGDTVSVYVDKETNEIMTYAQLLIMTNIADVFVPITISEEDILKVSIGQEASVTMNAFPSRAFPAQVDTITVESARSGAATVSYTVSVRFQEENSLAMYEGMSAEVTLVERAAEDVLYVSNQAITNVGGVATVLKKGEDGMGVETTVKTGFSDGRYVEILEGLSEGDVVLVISAVGRI